MGALKLFSIRSRPLFHLLVIGLGLFSIGAWWSVKTAIDADIRSRLESETDRISSTFRGRLSAYGNTLYHVRAYYLSSAPRSLPQFRTEFRDYIGQLEITRRFPGVTLIGYLDVRKKPDGTLASAIAFEEPYSQRQVEVGADLLADPLLQTAMKTSLQTGEPTMAAIRPSARPHESENEPASGSFTVFLPVLKPFPARGAPPGIIAGSLQGAMFATFRASDLFEGAFGSPSLTKENVNYTLEFGDGPDAGETIYNRFDAGIGSLLDTNLATVRNFKLLGRNLRFSVSPLPHFFSKSDRYLPAAVAFGAAFISILILLVLKASQTQLEYETRAKEVSLRAAEQSRHQSALLGQLNEFSKSLASGLDLNTQGTKLLQFASEIARAQSAILYLATEKADDFFIPLIGSRGVPDLSCLKKRLTSQEGLSIIPNGFILRQSDEDATDALGKIFTNTDTCAKTLEAMEERFSDWVFVSVSSREFGRSGLLFVARSDGSRFESMEIEILESLVSQASSTIESAKLFRSVDDANRAKNAFLSNMSHEIRTPLNAIIGFSEMLLENRIADHQRTSVARNIRKGGEQLTRIIDDILDLSKVESGKLLIVNRRVRLSRFLDETRQMMESRAKEKGLAFLIETSPPLPGHIWIDDVRLKQVLLNLIGNAIKFTERGSIILHVRYIADTDGENSLALRIKDTGIGIGEASQKSLFRPFSQADSSSTRRYGGSGLGLALSKRLCRELGGDLQLLESIAGRGSTFEARVKIGAVEPADLSDESPTLTESREGQPATAQAVGSALNGAHVLVVEDSEDNQEIFRFFLENAGAKVDIVSDGLEAVKRAATSIYDIILMDIQIPEIDGKEATRRIRGQGFGRPIVALTAHAMHEERMSCIEAGCDGQITKPVSGDGLIAEVAEYLRRYDERIPAYS